MNYLSRSLTILNLETLTSVTEIPVTAETLPPDILRGKILFNNASDPRLSQGSWISCASCHPDGGTDGVTWIFPDGPRQTPPLWNSHQTLPWHWSAALDEAQDVEDTVQHIQHGLGLAPGTDPELLGWPNHGRATDLDALAAFMAQGIRTPNPSASADVSAGRQLFQTAGCAACHGGPAWTSSQLPGPLGTLDPDGNGMIDTALHDVATLNPRDIRGETGFDPPSLLNVGLTAPYLHDGSLATLAELLTSGHPNPTGEGNGLSTAEIEALVLFLRAIGTTTAPITTSD
jgi:cytochrome c peroxidase